MDDGHVFHARETHGHCRRNGEADRDWWITRKKGSDRPWLALRVQRGVQEIWLASERHASRCPGSRERGRDRGAANASRRLQGDWLGGHNWIDLQPEWS